MPKQIAYITDIHLDDSFPIDAGVNPRKNWKTILADVQSRNIRDIILGGDIGEPVSHDWFFESVKDFEINMSLGNHDSYADILQYYSKQSQGIDELYYSFEEGGFKYIFLDSSSSWILKSQMQWLKREIVTDKQILLFIHHPILAVDTPVDRAYPLFNREQVRSVLQSVNNKIIVFAGHYHMTDESGAGNIAQYVSSAASIQLVKDTEIIETDNSFFGYRLLTIHENTIESEFILFQ